MKRLFIIGILTGIAFLLVQCGKQSTPTDESEVSNPITIQTSETATSTYAGSSALWAEYRCLEDAADSTCDVRILEIGDADGMLYQVYLDSDAIESESGPILLSGSGYDLAVTIKSSQGGKDGSSGSGGKRMLTMTIQPTLIPRLPYPPCYSTTSLSQSLATRHYTLDSAKVSRDDLLAWITYRGGSAAPQFSLVAWYPGVASTGDTTECYLRFSASDTSGPVIKARLGFNLKPLSDIIAQITPCLCVSTLRVLRPQNNWHSGFEVAEFERTVAAEELEPPMSPIPLTEGSYWVYQVKKTGYAGQCETCVDSVAVVSVTHEACKVRIRLNRAFAFLPRELEYCNGDYFRDGNSFQFPTGPFTDTAIVPIGTVHDCADSRSSYYGSGWGTRVTTLSDGLGIVRHSDVEVSVRYGVVSSYLAELIRYHIVTE